jgi:hypothetical protein
VTLFTEIEFLDDRRVTSFGGSLEVIKQAAPSGNELEKSTTGGMILCVNFQVLGER